MSLSIFSSYLPFYGGYHAFLTLRATFYRIKSRVSLGYATSEQQSPESFKLEQATRAQGNFVENIPMALILYATLEQFPMIPRWVLHVFHAINLLARVAHAEWGIMRPKALGIGRVTGHATQQMLIIVSSALVLWQANFGVINYTHLEL